MTLMRPCDTLARLGGDEYVVLCTNLSRSENATAIATRVAEAFRQPLRIGLAEVDITITITIGIATPEHSLADSTALLRDADAAMYAAKRRGRGAIATFTPEMRLRAVERMTLETALHHALEDGQLSLHYQPIIYLADQSLIAFEALIRWTHPSRGMIPPDEFIPIAEDSGLILPIGEWVIDTACQEAARWNAQRPDERPIGVSINISGWQLGDSDLPGSIERSCERSGVPASQIALELTETVLLASTQAAATGLDALRSIGVEVWLDDFGTGYSSLANIRRFPLTGIKLDRSFIADIATSTRDRDIIRAVTAMATALELPVTAEGIERPDHDAILRDLGCLRGQGYHYSRPMPADGALLHAAASARTNGSQPRA
jgi:predicted signal transduction protein with EAL and GGDEF domain